MGGIFNNCQIVLLGDPGNLMHLAGVAAVMHDHDRFGLGRYLRFNRSWAESTGMLKHPLPVGSRGGHRLRNRGRDP